MAMATALDEYDSLNHTQDGISGVCQPVDKPEQPQLAIHVQ
jgi:hypothetical protein